MWNLSQRFTLRERTTFNRAVKSLCINKKRFQHDLALQLDYYMSPQFAGVASALVNGSYANKGIDISFLPICPVGEELANVRKNQDANPSGISVGTVEQNIFTPTLATNPELKTTAVAAMFGQSPLCIASLKDPSTERLKIGTHEDTVEIMRRIFPSHDVVASPRATKNSDLLSGEVGAIQAYTTTEVPTLRRELGHEPVVTPLEGLNGTKLGYSQVIFAADECLQGDKRAIVQAFCEATFDGWEKAIRHPDQVVEMVNEAKKMLNLDDESNDHWHSSTSFELEMLQKCDDYVKQTYEGQYGVINSSRWNEANDWLLKEKSSENFGFDPEIWQPQNNLLTGNNLARSILEDAKTSANAFEKTYGRKPSLAVITVGVLKRYNHSTRRLQIYSNLSNSWFSKTSTGEANGFDVQEINLDAATTTDELLSKIYELHDVDGIQLMWPLPDHIDTAKVYSAIDVCKDVDGIHYIGQLEIGNKKAYAPVTPAATIALMDEFKLDVKGKRVLVIGRSPIVGSPISHMMREKGAAVTVVHSEVPEVTLKELVGETDVLITCAGLPGLVKAEWINGADVINVGTTFVEEIDSLVSDIKGDIAKYANKHSPVPGGVGPISAPILFKNVVTAAWDRMNAMGTVRKEGWIEQPSRLRKVYHFDSYTEALEAAKEIDGVSTEMDHHANMTFTHKCVDGVDLAMEFFTFEAGKVTQKDYDAARAVDMLLAKKKSK